MCLEFRLPNLFCVNWMLVAGSIVLIVSDFAGTAGTASRMSHVGHRNFCPAALRLTSMCCPHRQRILIKSIGAYIKSPQYHSTAASNLDRLCPCVLPFLHQWPWIS